ncbi:MAG: hypothetical protein Q4G68_00945 [Planctomycetia bacterium]|nr:hypothetical protein [Planctomycetia bacterium]
MSRKFIPRRRPDNDMIEGGQDSFLDIISNIVGILIILVMIAGAGVGAVGQRHTPSSAPTTQESDASLPEPVTAPTEQSFADRYQEEKEFLKLTGEMAQVQQEVLDLRQETSTMDGQLTLLKRQADMAEQEHESLLLQVTRLQGALEAETQKKANSEQEIFRRQQELARLQENVRSLGLTKESLTLSMAQSVKKIENVPTPLTKKVEGHEGYFRLKGGKVSHVPMNVFTERVRSTFRGIRDFKQAKIEETIGPVDDYSFHFEASLRQVRDGERIVMSVFFDYGECVPVREDIGELFADAIADNSRFQQKLSLYLRDSSTITLFVYPDSFDLLRNLKKFLIERGYTIALRPMPMDQYITVSPYGTASQSY